MSKRSTYANESKDRCGGHSGIAAISSELLDQIVTGPMTQQGIEEGDLWACVRRQPCGHRVDQ